MELQQRLEEVIAQSLQNDEDSESSSEQDSEENMSELQPAPAEEEVEKKATESNKFEINQ